MFFRPLPSLVGLALGCLLGWHWPAPHAPAAAVSAPSAVSSAPPPRPSFKLAAWDWRTSPLTPALSPADARVAIAAWLAQSDTDGAPIPFAFRAESLHALLARLPADLFPLLLTPLSALGGADDDRLFEIAFNYLVEFDPATAARWAATVVARPGFVPSFWGGLAVQAWARLDLAAASAWVLALTDPDLMRWLGGGLLTELAKTDPGTAMRTFGPSIWQNSEGYWALRGSLSAWAAREPSAALAWLLNQPNTMRDQITFWIGALADPPSGEPASAQKLFTLLDAISAQPVFAEQRSASTMVMRRIASAGPTALLSWLDQHKSPHERDALIREITNPQWGSSSPETGLTLALSLPVGTDRTRIMGGHLDAWAKRDPSAALAWIAAQDDPGVRAAAPKAQAAILGVIARDEPATAVAEWQTLADARVRAASIPPIVESWASRDPAAALAWLRSLGPASEIAANERQVTVGTALHAWSQREPEAALRWAETAPPVQSADYLQRIAGDAHGQRADRATVSDLYTKITDPALRTEVLTAHVREWLTKDRPAAQAWLESNSTLTAEQAAALLVASPTKP